MPGERVRERKAADLGCWEGQVFWGAGGLRVLGLTGVLPVTLGEGAVWFGGPFDELVDGSCVSHGRFDGKFSSEGWVGR